MGMSLEDIAKTSDLTPEQMASILEDIKRQKFPAPIIVGAPHTTRLPAYEHDWAIIKPKGVAAEHAEVTPLDELLVKWEDFKNALPPLTDELAKTYTDNEWLEHVKSNPADFFKYYFPDFAKAEIKPWDRSLYDEPIEIAKKVEAPKASPFAKPKPAVKKPHLLNGQKKLRNNPTNITPKKKKRRK